MGLDITAYSRLVRVDVVFDEDGEPMQNGTHEHLHSYVRVYANPCFPGRESPFSDRAIYLFTDCKSALSLSYGGYNRWREALAKLAGYTLTGFNGPFGAREQSHAAACWQGATGPFSELINFADNEGTIGSDAAQKLLADFIEWDERAKTVDHPRFHEIYTQMREGLELAADGGALDFR